MTAPTAHDDYSRSDAREDGLLVCDFIAANVTASTLRTLDQTCYPLAAYARIEAYIATLEATIARLTAPIADEALREAVDFPRCDSATCERAECICRGCANTADCMEGQCIIVTADIGCGQRVIATTEEVTL